MKGGKVSAIEKKDSQYDRFKEAARMIGADESKEAISSKLSIVANELVKEDKNSQKSR